MVARRAMWRCPSCGRSFAAARQVHTCRPLGDLDAHFRGADPTVREIFDRIVAEVAALGPVEVLPEKTRVALHARMSFAAFVPRRHRLDGHLVLARTVESPRFHRVEVYSAHNVLHAVRLSSPDDLDDEFRGWLAEAYRVGRQDHRR
jgi:Domain of unknown function (DUF5655)